MLTGKMSIFRVFFFLFIIIALFVVIDIIVATKKFEYPGNTTEDIIVEIPRGASLTRMADILLNAGAIDSVREFVIVVRILRASDQLQAGEYRFSAGASMNDIFQALRSGDTLAHSITFAEGLTSQQMVRTLNARENLSGTIETVPTEGRLLPETYSYHKGDGRQQILNRMASAQTEYLDDLWISRSDGFSLSKEEAVVLASIIEKESAITEERPLIAAVFLNRLRLNMRLQSDPTVIYGITQGEPLGRRLLDRDLQTNHPYNTYRNRGLPPHPIANPGKSSLHAVFYPAVSDALYFVADGTGGHVFANTLEEHNANVRNWRHIRRQMDASE